MYIYIYNKIHVLHHISILYNIYIGIYTSMISHPALVSYLPRQVDRFNPDNQVSVAEAELLKRAGAMASKARSFPKENGGLMGFNGILMGFNGI